MTLRRAKRQGINPPVERRGPHRRQSWSGSPAPGIEDAYRIFDKIGVGICISDETDIIRYANQLFRSAFLPLLDDRPTEFTAAFLDSVRAGQGVRIESDDLGEFANRVRARRRSQVDSLSFMADAVDGRWWRVTDSKLDNGWMIAVAQDVTSLKNEEFELRDAYASAVEEAQTDFLTGAPNRRAGLRCAQDLFAASRAVGGLLAVAVMDIDRFKTINDTRGHEIGDRALIHLAGILMREIGPRDHLSRIGGEEFLLISTEPDPGYLDALLSRLLRPLPPLVLDGGHESLSFTVSAGLALASANESWQDLLHRADLALYQAKAAGRDSLRHACPGK